MLNAQQVASLSRALPFWLSLTLIPLAWIGAFYGGWTVALLPLATWYLFSGLDAVLGLNTENADPNIGEEHLAAYSLITKIWIPLQFITLFGLLYYVPRAEHLEALETVVLFFGVGVITGTVGINYSHELMHQKNKFERWLGDILLSMVLYSHFRTEHLLVHHRYVGTPRDAVTARYNEGFYRYFPRVLRAGPTPAFTAHKDMPAPTAPPCNAPAIPVSP